MTTTPTSELHPEAAKVLFLVSNSRTPCGVEMFARELLRNSTAIGIKGQSFALSGELAQTFSLWPSLRDVSAVVANFPLVAWKKALLTPALAFALVRLRGAKTTVVLHEWSDLDWRRRLVIGVYLLMAQTILFSSPIVRAQFAKSPLGKLPVATGLVPIPPNVSPPPIAISTSLASRLAAEKAKGRLVLAQFGSIYPKKRTTFLFEVAAELKRMSVDVFVVFIGSFIAGSSDQESEFRARAAGLGIDDYLVTGYVETDAEIFALFAEVDAFAYSFAEGLSSRRGSVLACLQSGRQVIVNGPASPDEFDHHGSFRAAIERSTLHLLPTLSDAKQFAAAIVGFDLAQKPEPLDLFDASWRAAALSVRSGLSASIAKATRQGRSIVRSPKTASFSRMRRGRRMAHVLQRLTRSSLPLLQDPIDLSQVSEKAALE